MNILVVEGVDHPISPTQEHNIKSKNIICPDCKEDIKFKIEDYVINLYECKNKHDIDNIFFNEFDSTQNINISKIICKKCGNYNKSIVHNDIYFINVIVVKKIYVLFVIQIMIKIIMSLIMMIKIIFVNNIINHI